MREAGETDDAWTRGHQCPTVDSREKELVKATFFWLPQLSYAFLSVFCGDSPKELFAVVPFGNLAPEDALEAIQESLPNRA